MLLLAKIQNNLDCTSIWSIQKVVVTLRHQNAEKYGAIAQLVEQRTENPCVPGSIPGGTTSITIRDLAMIIAGSRFFILVDRQLDHLA